MNPSHCPAHPDAQLKPAIRGARDQFWGFDGVFDYHECTDCGTWILIDPPEPTALGTYYGGYYSEEEFESRRKAFVRGDKPPILGVDGVRAAETIKALRARGVTVDERIEVLDVGCGVGGFMRGMEFLAQTRVRGLDFNPRCRDFVAEVHGHEVDVGELEAQEYPDERFDVVTSWHCLEHTYDPLAELKEMRRIVKPGGWIMLEVPTPSLIARLFRGRWFFLQPPTHLFHLSRTALETLVSQANLTVEGVWRPWLPTELSGSLLFALGHHGFARRILFGRKSLTNVLWMLLFALTIPLDLVITPIQRLFGKTGVMRVLARREETQ